MYKWKLDLYYGKSCTVMSVCRGWVALLLHYIPNYIAMLQCWQPIIILFIVIVLHKSKEKILWQCANPMTNVVSIRLTHTKSVWTVSSCTVVQTVPNSASVSLKCLQGELDGTWLDGTFWYSEVHTEWVIRPFLVTESCNVQPLRLLVLGNPSERMEEK